ncbi:hypothetical protein [Bradyrhizobium cenepequi]|uniref:hypothetical protein n=1 Tax=Bradyrhizobium cenepequi TaxID=2821403 RepID=UPI001CE382A8|nr:hypothetical protein [Bradyrhizobium cenepequi]MCA6108045.1 hypothetical protein [Bradyrhizobium cenepequi]
MTSLSPLASKLFGLPGRARSRQHSQSRISAWPDWLRKAGIDIGQTPRGQVFDHFFLCIEAAINGYDIALVLEAHVSLDIAERRVGILLPQSRIIGSGFYDLFNPSARKARSVEQFITWLTQEGSRLTPRERLELSGFTRRPPNAMSNFAAKPGTSR